MKLPKVMSTEREGMDGWCWIPFDLYAKQEWYSGFAWDYITRDEINHVRPAPLFSLQRDWEDDIEVAMPEALFDMTRRDRTWRRYHAKRIKGLAFAISRGAPVKPISVDIWYGSSFVGIGEHSGISNGHHRLRALQYLGYRAFPASMSGVSRIIDDLYLKSCRQLGRPVVGNEPSINTSYRDAAGS